MRSRVVVVLGVIQLAVGAFVALRPLTGAPLTNSRALDMAFAAYFLIRGAMNIRNAIIAWREPTTTVHPPHPPDR